VADVANVTEENDPNPDYPSPFNLLAFWSAFLRDSKRLIFENETEHRLKQHAAEYSVANRFSKLPHFMEPEVHYRVHNSPPLVPGLS